MQRALSGESAGAAPGSWEALPPPTTTVPGIIPPALPVPPPLMTTTMQSVEGGVSSVGVAMVFASVIDSVPGLTFSGSILSPWEE